MRKSNTEVNELLVHYGGPIKGLLEDKTITEICIDHYDNIYVERNGLLEDTDVAWPNEAELSRYIQQIANSVGQVVNRQNPLLDARLPDGARINATLPPVSVHGACMSIRPYPAVHRTMEDLIEGGAIQKRSADLIVEGLNAKLNMLVTGGTGSGKTSFLRALLFLLDEAERVGIVEDTNENLAPGRKRKVELEAPRRKRALSDDQIITLVTLIEEILRKRIDRLVGGELRTPAACAAFLDAMATGHGGCLGTLHTSGAIDTIDRLITLFARQATNVDRHSISDLILSNLDISIYIAKDVEQQEDGTRRVTRRVKEIMWIDEQKKPHLLMKHRVKTGHEYNEVAIAAYRSHLESIH
ncbi:CpaF family protein [Gluconacetobacter diazotrophicus]|uniref:Putative conjugal transfer protein n=1 Tax=Gluconacetobacter diazotrophicus (strain ATCC 49037 / DSM 5601 / CCUG 37298 / CIP 103539 / LMG 7603 / PAl5) TaxID=272568 RepID=A9HT32_GLUDA|nr:ATPase, T2SS/T4P/T4SS family [Gluconacetobacter diazotrophicus]CAP57855.1 putative conjugal transfer protein [Gluconacetobacter diazotrophicus PA1 5]